MKTFNDDLEHVEIKLKDNKGNEKVKKAKYLTIKDLKEIDKISNGKKDEESNFDILCKQMAYIFGGKSDDYEGYSFPLLKNVMKYVKEVYLINPLDQKNQIEK